MRGRVLRAAARYLGRASAPVGLCNKEVLRGEGVQVCKGIPFFNIYLYDCKARKGKSKLGPGDILSYGILIRVHTVQNQINTKVLDSILGWPLGYLNIFPYWFHKDPKYLIFVKGLQGPTKYFYKAGSNLQLWSSLPPSL